MASKKLIQNYTAKKVSKIYNDYESTLSESELAWLKAFDQLAFYSNDKPLNELGVNISKDLKREIMRENYHERYDAFKQSSNIPEQAFNKLCEADVIPLKRKKRG